MNLIFVNGTMGVGKTSVCRELAKILPENVFLDGDTCLAATPFRNTEAHRTLILKNIADLLNNFLQSGLFENILFCWVMHEKEIVQDILSRLHGEFTFRIFTLTCEKEELFARLRRDVSAGIRDGGKLRARGEYGKFRHPARVVGAQPLVRIYLVKKLRHIDRATRAIKADENFCPYVGQIA